MRIAAAIFATAACLWAQDTPAEDRLERFLARMQDTLLRQPNYTCTETVERTRQPTGSDQRIEDTLRLEVALVDSKEMFSWPGSKQFEDTDLADLVTTGMFGNGDFALYSRMLFFGGGPGFEYRGESMLGEQRVARYDFRVPRALSGHMLSVDRVRAAVGYHGSFYFDAETLDLRRLEIVADDIPPELGLTASEGRVDFSRVDIGGETFVLPSQSAMTMAFPDIVNRNRTRFTACRKFAGQSTLLFTDPEVAEAAAAEAATLREVALDPGTQVELILQVPIDLRTAYVGAEVEARLNRELKRGRDVLVPKGAIARGRIVRLERYPDFFVLGLKWQDLDWKGGHARLNLAFERMGTTVLLTGTNSPAVYREPTSGDILIQRRSSSVFEDVLTVWMTRP